MKTLSILLFAAVLLAYTPWAQAEISAEYAPLDRKIPIGGALQIGATWSAGCQSDQCGLYFTYLSFEGDCGSECANLNYGYSCNAANYREFGFIGRGYTSPGIKTVIIKVISCKPPSNDWVPASPPAGVVVDSYTATFEVIDDSGSGGSGSPVSTVPCSPNPPMLLNPIGPAPYLLNGSSITSDTDVLANASNIVSGVAADGVSRVILRIPAHDVGEEFNISIIGNSGQLDTESGDLSPLGESTSGANSLVVQAVGNPAFAYAVYRSPADFYRGEPDATAITRGIQLRVTCTDAAGEIANASTSVKIVRPPVILVHGLWAKPDDTWPNFHPPATETAKLQLWNALEPYRLSYSQIVTGVDSTVPAIGVSNVNRNALGFSYNAPYVLSMIRTQIEQFGRVNNVAVVQADIVAHSMGGDISRMASGLNYFADSGNFEQGSFHKLITIGTPHLGTPLATNLLPHTSGDTNACVRRVLGYKGMHSLETVTLHANSTSISGAVGDLRDDPSTTLPVSQFFPVAFLAGRAVPADNYRDLGSSISLGISTWCWEDTLAARLTTSGWASVFDVVGQPHDDSDGVVPLKSQLDDIASTSANTFLGIIHSPGFKALDFSPPTEVDAESGIPSKVVDLLNKSVYGSDFLWQSHPPATRVVFPSFWSTLGTWARGRLGPATPLEGW